MSHKMMSYETIGEAIVISSKFVSSFEILIEWEPNNSSLGGRFLYFHDVNFQGVTTLRCSFIQKPVVIVYTSSLYENAPKTTRHSCFTRESIVQA